MLYNTPSIAYSIDINQNNVKTDYKLETISEIDKLFKNANTSNFECIVNQQKIKYSGELSKHTLDCLNASPNAETLIITSTGGEVEVSIDIAREVKRRNMSVEVLAMCASSCGNYIIPAAENVVVHPYAAILLHGAPADEEEVMRTLLIDALKEAGVPEESITKELVDQHLTPLLNTRKKHEDFQLEFNIKDKWYSANFELSNQIESEEQPDFVLVHPEIALNCNAINNKEKFWYPDTLNEKLIIRNILQLRIDFVDINKALLNC